MIKIRIKNADHEIDVRFPISENELYEQKLDEVESENEDLDEGEDLDEQDEDAPAFGQSM